MKIKPVISLAILASLTCGSYAASLQFPGQPFPDPFTVPSPAPGEEGFGVLNAAWTPSQDANSDLRGFYATVGSYQGVGVGALVDDYIGVLSAFSVSTSTDTIAIGSATVGGWFFSLTAPTIAPRNAFSIDLTGSTAALTIDLTPVLLTPGAYQVDVNGAFTGFVYEGGLYQLTASFGAVTGVTGAISSFDNSSSILFADPTTDNSGNFASLQIGADLGGAGSWGDGYITVVPEPGTTMLVSLLPAFFILRRRR